MAGTLSRLTRFIRYRFMLIAGLLPYGLGTAVASYQQEKFNLFLFLIAFIGLLFVLVGVEALNEFFDWQLGTDRVFLLNPKPVSRSTFLVGAVAFLFALMVAIFLTLKVGIGIIILSLVGFLAALFYLGPPIKLVYRGFGEIIIAICYGPLMMLGSYYVQIQQINFKPLFVSLIPASLLFAISIMNEVPDYFQDKLVGKKNICVRIGQRNVVRLYGILLIFFYLTFLAGLFSGNLPHLAWAALACLPISLLSYTAGMRTCKNAYKFVLAIRYAIIQYVIVLTILITSYTV